MAQSTKQPFWDCLFSPSFCTGVTLMCWSTEEIEYKTTERVQRIAW